MDFFQIEILKHTTPHATWVLYNGTEQSQGFFICFMIKNL